MAYGLVVAARNNRLNQITALIDAGAGAGLLRIYGGVRPATGGTPGELLAELTLSDPSFPAAAGGSMSANPITDDSAANNTGDATWFRLTDSNGVAVADGSVGVSGAELNLNTISITAGVSVSVTSLTLTDGNA